VTAAVLAWRSFEYWLAQYRRVWRGTIVTSIVNPVFYLGALGIGLGTLLTQQGTQIGGSSYLDFVAPGLLAATAMQVAAQEASWPVMGSIKWTRVYYAMLSSPLGVRDVFAGHQFFVLTRALTTSALYLAVIAAFGAVDSPVGLLALPGCFLVACAFSTACAAYAIRADSDGAFNPLFRFFIVPMFLFSGTFFPVARLPEVLEWVAYATPLWHGVDMCRDFASGRVDWLEVLGHSAYLVAWTAVAGVLAVRGYAKRLIK